MMIHIYPRKLHTRTLVQSKIIRRVPHSDVRCPNVVLHCCTSLYEDLSLTIIKPCRTRDKKPYSLNVTLFSPPQQKIQCSWVPSLLTAVLTTNYRHPLCLSYNHSSTTGDIHLLPYESVSQGPCTVSPPNTTQRIQSIKAWWLVNYFNPLCSAGATKTKCAPTLDNPRSGPCWFCSTRSFISPTWCPRSKTSPWLEGDIINKTFKKHWNWFRVPELYLRGSKQEKHTSTFLSSIKPDDKKTARQDGINRPLVVLVRYVVL